MTSSTDPAADKAASSAVTVGDQDTPPDKLDPRVLRIAGVVVIGAIMSILDMTVVSVAIPTFQEEFDVTYAIAAWSMTGYTLALATVIPLTGWAADRFGTKRLYLTALTLFVLGSVLCSFAWSAPSLIGFRILQGLGGGMLMPLGMTIMTRAAGPQRIGRVMAVLGVPMLLGPICGPILGGWLIEAASWHWIFLINVPIGIVAFTLAFIVLDRDAPVPSEKFDFLGMLLLSPGLALLLFGVSSMPEVGTVASARVLIPMVIGVILLASFVPHALRTEHPLIDLHLFRNRNLAAAVGTMILFAIAFFGAALLIPSYFLQVRGETTLAAGLLMAPQGLGAMITMPIAGRLVDKIGPGKIVLTGVSVIGVALAALTQVGATTPYPLLCSVLFVMGLGMGCTMMPTMTAALQTLTHAQVARGSTLMNIVNQTGGSIGTATMSVVLTNLLLKQEFAGPAIASQTDPSVAATLPPGAIDVGLEQAAEAFGHTFIVAVVLIVLTLIPASFLPRKKPAATGPEGEGAAVGAEVMH
ncbi:DHA2 family efflux MFS transporter permease subunit [Aldersonia sp. NBC_00410]|uniref:DHA2 family efflux MFS transporter permease subunit n=1 Tax=Aldersonia sp. NBC_00410 TaxID=2975954 RepID=UPI00225ACF6E|nr:DHA2 family efflux MFS transporter permease subunit [Aldersonia sp. NBC_00410]MCX5042941.1 DHA2 family efflux MFS transporter permease subunit [Aldersonia sp. NBC_00410]